MEDTLIQILQVGTSASLKGFVGFDPLALLTNIRHVKKDKDVENKEEHSEIKSFFLPDANCAQVLVCIQPMKSSIIET